MTHQVVVIPLIHNTGPVDPISALLAQLIMLARATIVSTLVIIFPVVSARRMGEKSYQFIIFSLPVVLFLSTAPAGTTKPMFTINTSNDASVNHEFPSVSRLYQIVFSCPKFTKKPFTNVNCQSTSITSNNFEQ